VVVDRVSKGTALVREMIVDDLPWFPTNTRCRLSLIIAIISTVELNSMHTIYAV
jgi:hypothetical protein